MDLILFELIKWGTVSASKFVELAVKSPNRVAAVINALKGFSFISFFFKPNYESGRLICFN